MAFQGMFADARSDDALPMQKMLEAAMQANGEAQGQAQARKVASDQMDAPPPKFSFTGKHAPGGVPIVKFEGPADLLNGTQQTDVQKAYMLPKQNVQNAISSGAARTQPDSSPVPMENAGAFEARKLREVGYNPQPTDATGAGLQSSYGAEYRAQRELGEPVIKAALKAGLAKAGLFNNDRLADNLNRQHALVNARAFENAAEPVLKEQDTELSRRERMDALQNSQFARQMQYQRLNDEERRQVLSEKQGYINGINGALVPRSQWRAALDAQNQTGYPMTEFEYNRAEQKFTQDQAADFNNFRKDKDGLATYASPVEAAKSRGYDLTNAQTSQLTADWTAARNAQQMKQANQDRANQRLAFAMRDKPEKPRKLTGFDATNASTDALTAAAGDPSFDQTSVKQAIENRRGKITARLAELDAAMKGNSVEHEKLAPIIYEDAARTKVKEGAEQANPFVYTRVMDAENRGTKMAAEAATLKADLAKLPAPGQAAAPKPTSAAPAMPPVSSRKQGDKYTFPSGPNAGKTGTWTGSAWMVP